ncbi:MAG: methylated-DNA--[protein]-cysteine S-methyltransferase [Betaproteobacteria bacterium]|nr:methylated-DNA--[protein]-cysteine S-methyltransferase [Betaproteobacteria bacterium]
MNDDFRAAVYAMVKKVPKGKVATYGQIAALVGHPRHSRHVGFALSSMPMSVKIPWHRIINSAGRISLRRRNWDSGGDDLQKVLLEAEGVRFSAEGKVNLRVYRWEGAPKKMP